MYSGKMIEELIFAVERVQKSEDVLEKKRPASAGSTFMFLRNYRGEYNSVKVA